MHEWLLTESRTAAWSTKANGSFGPKADMVDNHQTLHPPVKPEGILNLETLLGLDGRFKKAVIDGLYSNFFAAVVTM
ncbi:MAG: hypothetical protein AAED33_15160 [Paracoccaceae bacterium]